MNLEQITTSSLHGEAVRYMAKLLNDNVGLEIAINETIQNYNVTRKEALRALNMITIELRMEVE